MGDGLLRLVELAPQGGPGLVLVGVSLHAGLLAAHLAELREDLVGGGPGVPQDALGLRLPPAPGVLLGPLHLFPELPGPAGVLLPLAQEPVRLQLPFLQGLALGLQLGQHVLKPYALAAELPPGTVDHRLRQAQPPGDGEGVGFARDAGQQAVGGT